MSRTDGYRLGRDARRRHRARDRARVRAGGRRGPGRRGRRAVDWQELPLGASAIEEHGSAIPAATMDALAELDGWLLGPHDSAAYPEPFRSQLNPSGAIRKHYDLYANIRPARGFEGGRRSPRTPTW